MLQDRPPRGVSMVSPDPPAKNRHSGRCLVSRAGESGELPLREHLLGEGPRPVVAFQPRQPPLSRDDASRVLEVTHERGRSDLGAWHAAIECIELLAVGAGNPSSAASEDYPRAIKVLALPEHA